MESWKANFSVSLLSSLFLKKKVNDEEKMEKRTSEMFADTKKLKESGAEVGMEFKTSWMKLSSGHQTPLLLGDGDQNPLVLWFTWKLSGDK